jgi:alpha-L-fucosidase
MPMYLVIGEKEMIRKQLLPAAMVLAMVFGAARAAEEFKPTAESLKTYKCPKWFRDAKLGIWTVWGPYTVPAVGDWYARNMYIENHRHYKYHVANYGHPSKVGYKDIIKMWKGEKFDADALVKLFKQAGAKYIVTMANHHDNYDLWDSKHHKWNSVNYGPKKDIVGLWRKATLKHDLRFGVTTHLARAYSWFQTSHLADKSGKHKGVPYDGRDPKNKDLYFETHGDTNLRHPLNPPESWRKQWAMRIKDLIDRYKPDHMYFDGAIPFQGDDKGKTGMEVIAYYYNANRRWHNGSAEGVLCIKNIRRHGFYIEGAATLDFERGRAKGIMPRPWQTDTSIGPWFWTRGARYRSAGQVVGELVDIVSKNGNLLLNIPPKADGTIDERAREILVGLGEWMKLNGEAIYGTRPWKVFGEGPVRFTRGKTCLYVISLKWPGAGKELVIGSLNVKDTPKISQVSLLGCADKLKWKQGDKDLTITAPARQPCNYAWSFKITLTKP